MKSDAMSPLPREIVTGSEMKRIDETCGIPSIELMENAARAVVRHLEEARLEATRDSLATKRVLIVTGRGNNAGDGFAVARLLHEKSRNVELMPLFAESELSPDAAINARAAAAAGVPFCPAARRSESFAAAVIVIDAIFGSGFRPERMPDACRDAIAMMNDRALRPANSWTLAIDIPSGACADTGQIFIGEQGAPHVVHADATITFGRPKRGLFLHPAAAMTGALSCDAIGIPDELFTSVPGSRSRNEEIAPLLPRRSPTAHKGSSRLLIIGGSRGMIGAPLLAARAALAANAGHVSVVLPQGAADPGLPVEVIRHRVAARMPEAAFDRSVEAEVTTLAQAAHAAVLGGGLGTGPVERGLAARWTRLIAHPTVIDADALRLINMEDLHAASAPRILTPHPGEFTSLFGGTVEDNESHRIDVAVAAAKRSGHVLLLKGAPTVIAAPDGRYVVNTTGDEKLATLGSGDVLSGVIGALLAQGLSPFDAAVCGAHLHGMTTRFWPHPVGLTASAIAEFIPHAWGECLGVGPA